MLLLGALAAGGAAWAEDPIYWYAALRRVAKYSSISSRGGATLDRMRPYIDELAALDPRIEEWSKRPGSDAAPGSCRTALRELQATLRIVGPAARYEAILASEPLRDDCQRSIWGQ